MVQSDINTREDIENLISRFYEKVRADDLLAPHFDQVDWVKHTPVIIEFWCMILLGGHGYKSNPFEKHMKMQIRQHHFERWLLLFSETVDENFSGPKASEAKDRARNIAGVFQHKMGLT